MDRRLVELVQLKSAIQAPKRTMASFDLYALGWKTEACGFHHGYFGVRIGNVMETSHNASFWAYAETNLDKQHGGV